MGLISKVRDIFTKDEDENTGGGGSWGRGKVDARPDFTQRLGQKAKIAALEIPRTIQEDIGGSIRDSMARGISRERERFNLLKQSLQGQKPTDFQRKRYRQQGVENLKRDVKDVYDVTKGALKTGTAAVGVVNPAALLGQAAIGTGIGYGANRLSGESRKESLQRGLLQTTENIPKYASMVGINKFTQPLMDARIGEIMGGAKTAIGGQLKARGTMSALNVAEGLVMDEVGGFETTPESVLIDAVSGATLFAGPANKPIKETVSGNIFQPIRQVKGDVLDKLKSQIKKAIDEADTELIERTVKEAAQKGIRVNSDMYRGLKRMMADERGFINMKEFQEKIANLRKSLETPEKQKEIKKAIDSYETTREKQEGIKIARDKVNRLTEQATNLKWKAVEAHNKGDFKLRDEFNDQKDALFEQADNIQKQVRQGFKKDSPSDEPIELSESFTSLTEKTKTIMDEHLPKRSEVINDTTAAKSAFETGRSVFQNWIDSLDKELKNIGITRETFTEMSQRDIKDVPKEFVPAVSKYKTIMDKLRMFSEHGNVGYIPGYYPHESGKLSVSDELDIFGDLLITKENASMGHLNYKRKGSLTNYSTDIPNVLKNYADQVLFSKYGDIAVGKTNRVKMFEHAKGLTNRDYSGYDYVGKLQKEHEQLIPEGKTLTTAGVFSGDRSIKSNLEWEDFENKEITDAYVSIRDGSNSWTRHMDKLNKFWLDGKIDQAVVYVGKQLGKEGDELENFARNSLKIVGQGPKAYSKWAKSSVYNMAISQPIESFLDTVGKYEFESKETRDHINAFIERRFNEADFEYKWADSIVNLRVSHDIGFNIKTMLTQLTETATLPVHYKNESVAKGIKRISNKGELEKLNRRYNFGDKTTEYKIAGEEYKGKKISDEELEKRLDKSTEQQVGELSSKIKDFTMAGVRKTDNLKNQLWAAVAEEEGLSKGLKGQDLIDYVNDEVYKHAHIAGEYNTPEALRDSRLLRALTLYMQYPVKAAFETLDYAKQKEYAKAGQLLAVRLASTALMAKAFGGSIKWAVQNLFPAFDGGPFVAAIKDTGRYLAESYDAYKNENWYRTSHYLGKAAIELPAGEIPAGGQLEKTGGYLIDRARGETQTPSKRKRFDMEGGILNTAMGLIGGTRATKESRKHWGTKHLSKSERIIKEAQKRNLTDKQFYSMLDEIEEENPTLHRNIIREIDDAKNEVTRKEKSLRNIPSKDGQRAKQITKELNKINSLEEFKETVKRWRDIGIITDDIKETLERATEADVLKIPGQKENNEIGINIEMPNIKLPSMRTAHAAEKPVDYEKDTTVYPELPDGPTVYSKEHGGWVRPHMVDFVGDNLAKKKFEQGLKKIFKRQLGEDVKGSTNLDEYFPLMDKLPYIYKKAKKFDRKGLKELLALQSFFESTAGRASNYNNLFGAKPGGESASFDNLEDSIDYQLSENVLAGGEEGSSMNILNKKGPITEEEIRELYKSYNPEQKYLETLIKFWKELTGKDTDVSK